MYLSCNQCNLQGLDAGYTIRRPSMPLITIAPGDSAPDAQAYPVSYEDAPQSAPIPAYDYTDYTQAVPQPDQTAYDNSADYQFTAPDQPQTDSYIPPAPYIPPAQTFDSGSGIPPVYYPDNSQPLPSQDSYVPPPPYIPEPMNTTAAPYDIGSTYEQDKAFYDSLPQNQPASHYIEMYGDPQAPQPEAQPVYYMSPVARSAPLPVAAPVQQNAPVQTQNVSSSGGGASITFNPVISNPVTTNVATNVSPQISPVFVQQQQPTDSGVDTGVKQFPASYGTQGQADAGYTPAPSGGGGPSYMNAPAKPNAVLSSGSNWLPWIVVAAILGIAAMPESENQRRR